MVAWGRVATLLVALLTQVDAELHAPYAQAAIQTGGCLAGAVGAGASVVHLDAVLPLVAPSSNPPAECRSLGLHKLAAEMARHTGFGEEDEEEEGGEPAHPDALPAAVLYALRNAKKVQCLQPERGHADSRLLAPRRSAS
jgi:hypothetical protein